MLVVMVDVGFVFLVVVKLDLGWCGFGVCCFDDDVVLVDYFVCYLVGEVLML